MLQSAMMFYPTKNGWTIEKYSEKKWNLMLKKMTDEQNPQSEEEQQEEEKPQDDTVISGN